MPDRRTPSYLDGLVLAAVAGAARPVSAYEVVSFLAEQGHHVAAPQAYRTLERLIASGQVVRIETLSAYRICDPGSASGGPFVFCRRCRAATQVDCERFTDRLRALSRSTGFRPSRIVVEIAGTCPACQAAHAVKPELSHAC
jgi:Fur family zinc uptake transcriptional regulator